MLYIYMIYDKYIYIYTYGCFQKYGWASQIIHLLIGFSIINHPFWLDIWYIIYYYLTLYISYVGDGKHIIYIYIILSTGSNVKYMIYEIHIYIYIHIHMGVNPKIGGGPPKSSILYNRVFLYFHHPFWGYQYSWKHPYDIYIYVQFYQLQVYHWSDHFFKAITKPGWSNFNTPQLLIQVLSSNHD